MTSQEDCDVHQRLLDNDSEGFTCPHCNLVVSGRRYTYADVDCRHVTQGLSKLMAKVYALCPSFLWVYTPASTGLSTVALKIHHYTTFVDFLEDFNKVCDKFPRQRTTSFCQDVRPLLQIAAGNCGETFVIPIEPSIPHEGVSKVIAQQIEYLEAEETDPDSDDEGMGEETTKTAGEVEMQKDAEEETVTTEADAGEVEVQKDTEEETVTTEAEDVGNVEVQKDEEETATGSDSYYSESSDDEDMGEETVTTEEKFCFCGVTEAECSNDMIECGSTKKNEGCKEWYHGSCDGILLGDDRLKDDGPTYICSICKN
jgi:hypothetical protein